MSAGGARYGELVTGGLGVVLALALLAAPDPPPRSPVRPRGPTFPHPRDAGPTCARTRGQVIKPYGRDHQLADDECVAGTVISEPGPSGQGGGADVVLNKGGWRHLLWPDGRVTFAEPIVIDEEPSDERLWVRSVRLLLRGGWGARPSG